MLFRAFTIKSFFIFLSFIFVCVCVFMINTSSQAMLENPMAALVFTVGHGLHRDVPITHVHTHTHTKSPCSLTAHNKIPNLCVHHITPHLILLFLHIVFLQSYTVPSFPLFFFNCILCCSLLWPSPPQISFCYLIFPSIKSPHWPFFTSAA